MGQYEISFACGLDDATLKKHLVTACVMNGVDPVKFSTGLCHSGPAARDDRA